MAPDLLQAARVRYRHKVPKDCFLANVPEWLRLTPDHVIAPSHGLQVKEGCKWIKVSQYEAFVQACRLFWNDYGLDAQQQSELHVIEMPYMPLIDAHKLHKLVNEPDIPPYTFAESLEYLKMKEARKANKESVGVDLGLARLFHEANEEEDDEESDWERKEGSITFPDLGGAVRFVVTNYSILWAKAEKQCLFMFMSDPMEDIISRLETCEKHLYYPPADMRQALEDDLEQAKRELIFAMYQSSE